MRVLFLLLIVLISSSIQAQETEIIEPIKPIEKVKTNKGTIYVFWGWNRSWYTNSDIHFTGENYNFTLNDVEATDRQSPFDLNTYFNPSTVTIPQTNFRLGYFINDRLDISFGIDHMKYVMIGTQNTEITGRINDKTAYDGNYKQESFNIDKDFLAFEHTDGLNYLNFEITANDDLLKMLKVKNNSDKIQINTLVGVGAGVLMPKSNVTLWNNVRHDDFHFAGYGFAAKAGLNITFFKHIVFRGEYKLGFINMPDIRTSPDPIDRASQHFAYSQLNFMVGYSFNPFN